MIRNVAPGHKKDPAGIGLLWATLSVIFIAFLIFIVLLTILMRQLFGSYIFWFDQKVFDCLSNYVTARNTVIMQVFTFLGSPDFLIPVFLLLFVYYYFIQKNKRHFLRSVIITVVNLLLMFGLKSIFDRSRPLNPVLAEAPGLSFPSGHALMGLIFFGQIISIIQQEVTNKWIRWVSTSILGIVILLIGLSRVYLRLHYTSDVIAGYFFAILSFLMLLWMFRKVEMANAKKGPA